MKTYGLKTYDLHTIETIVGGETIFVLCVSYWNSVSVDTLLRVRTVPFETVDVTTKLKQVQKLKPSFVGATIKSTYIVVHS